jgi:hypothetical protein
MSNAAIPPHTAGMARTSPGAAINRTLAAASIEQRNRLIRGASLCLHNSKSHALSHLLDPAPIRQSSQKKVKSDLRVSGELAQSRKSGQCARICYLKIPPGPLRDFGSTAAFGDRAHRSSVQLWMTERRG